MAKASASKSVNDVAKPDTAAPSSSAKPIIVSNRPVLKDPTVLDETKTEATASTSPSHSKLKLEPLTSTEANENSPTAVTTASKPAPAAAETPMSTETTEETASAEAEPDNPAPSKGSKVSETELKQQAERQAELEKMIAAQTYYLPINQVEKRRNRRATIIGVICVLILGLAWLDIALDSGILTIPGVKAPTHFFK